MIEQPLLFGPKRNLFGILTSPSPPASAAAPLACLLLNVGVTHRIGPRRLNVKLARQLAARGVHSFRLDLSGIGDSTAANSRANFHEQSMRDLQAAMNAIEATTGIQRFVVLGICSGAANGYWLALTDQRVVGLLMFDGFTFPTLKTRLLHDWHRFRTIPLKTGMSKGVRRVKRMLGLHAEPSNTSIFNVVSDSAVPTRAEFGAALQSMADRGVALYIAYSGSLLVHHNYHDQLKDALNNAPVLERVRYEYLPDIDHIATPLAAQRKLTSRVCDWVLGITSTPAIERTALANRG